LFPGICTFARVASLVLMVVRLMRFGVLVYRGLARPPGGGAPKPRFQHFCTLHVQSQVRASKHCWSS
jgi:hypothetical protein